MSNTSDKLWHFDAPRYYDFGKTEEENNHQGDTWFARQATSSLSVSSLSTLKNSNNSMEKDGNLDKAREEQLQESQTSNYMEMNDYQTLEYQPINYTEDVYLNSPSQRRTPLKRRDMKKELVRTQTQQEQQGYQNSSNEGTSNGGSTRISLPSRRAIENEPSYESDHQESKDGHPSIQLPQRRRRISPISTEESTAPSFPKPTSPLTSNVSPAIQQHDQGNHINTEQVNPLSSSNTNQFLSPILGDSSIADKSTLTMKQQHMDTETAGKEKQQATGNSAYSSSTPENDHIMEDQSEHLSSPNQLRLPTRKRVSTERVDDITATPENNSRSSDANTIVSETPLLKLIAQIKSQRQSPVSRKRPRSVEMDDQHDSNDQPSSPLLQLIARVQSYRHIPKLVSDGNLGRSSWKMETIMNRARRVIDEAHTKSRQWIIPSEHQRLSDFIKQHQKRRFSTTAKTRISMISKHSHEDNEYDISISDDDDDDDDDDTLKDQHTNEHLDPSERSFVSRYLPVNLTIPRSPKFATNKRSRRW